MVTKEMLVAKLQTTYVLMFEHCSLKNSDGTPVRARQTGKLKVWVRSPSKFQLPVKHGMYQSFYIDNNNASDWRLV
jgi:hypothetical protein